MKVWVDISYWWSSFSTHIS